MAKGKQGVAAFAGILSNHQEINKLPTPQGEKISRAGPGSEDKRSHFRLPVTISHSGKTAPEA